MTGEDIIAEFRRVTQDNASPPLWTDDDILTYASDAESEACERARLIEDRTTTACCAITLVAGTASYALHASVFLVKRVTYLGRALEETSVEKMDARDSNWESRTGVPCEFIQTEGSLRVVPTPTAEAAADGGLAMTVYRTPLLPIEGETSPEIAARLHMRLMHWVYRCAYLKKDSDTFDLGESSRHEQRFEAAFGERPDANVQNKRRDRRPPVTRINW